MSNAIEVKNLCKKFLIPHKKITTVFDALRNFNRVQYETLNALDGVSFEVKHGQAIGIIGRNGSGKTTLLNILAKIIEPTSGEFKTNGKIIPLLELGIGFQDGLTAKENVYLSCIIMGLNKRQIDERFDTIIGFAGLQNFVDAPLRDFSTGMRAKLAFSTAIQTEGDIFFVDEVLAVGDLEFQEKCLRVFDEFKKKGKTILFVSHDPNLVKRLCDSVILLDSGKIVEFGETEKVVEKYMGLIKENNNQK